MKKMVLVFFIILLCLASTQEAAGTSNQEAKLSGNSQFSESVFMDSKVGKPVYRTRPGHSGKKKPSGWFSP